MKTFQDLLANTKIIKGKTIIFAADIDFTESYAEQFMKAEIVNIDNDIHDPDIIRIKVNYGNFRDHNAPLESANYYSEEINEYVTTSEAGSYEDIEIIYFMKHDGFEDYFTIL